MLALGLLLNIAGIGVFCWLVFTLAVYALPFLVAINAGTWAFHNGGVCSARHLLPSLPVASRWRWLKSLSA